MLSHIRYFVNIKKRVFPCNKKSFYETEGTTDTFYQIKHKNSISNAFTELTIPFM